MPIVNIQWASGRSDQQKEKIAKEITDAIANEVDIDPNRVTIIFSDIEHTNLAQGGELRSKQ